MTDLIIDYLQGSGVIIIVILYIILYNFISEKYFKFIPNDIFGYILIPIIMPIAVGMMIAVVLIAPLMISANF